MKGNAQNQLPMFGGLKDDLPRPHGSRLGIAIIVAGLLALFIWAAFSKIDQVTRASARVIAAERTQVIQTPDAGVVTKLHVREGDVVKTGQLLVTLEKERAQAAVDDSKAKVAALRITLSRLQAEVYGKSLRFDSDLLLYSDYIRNQTDLYNRRQTAFNGDIGSLQRMLKIADRELQINSRLVATFDVSVAEVLRLERAAADISAQITNRRNKYFQDSQTEMTKAQEDLNTQQELLRDRIQVLDHTELLAPTNGIVNNVRATTLGAVLRAGDTVLEISPTDGDLIAEAKVNPSDIAFVEVGQTAFVKLDAYDSSIFGALTGRVTYVSPDSLTEDSKQGPTSFYRVHVLVKEAEFKSSKTREIQMRPGLTATVEIKARERTVLSYLTKPISKTLSYSMGER
ncbi:HlyD family efflux transporter periplasmic adaptor subunit [Variovorax sp. RHLX14]|uniref:HlyD family efflux transporter periplasmic adaptor subunit n=1 Tax=Variovorax sp. RHLX14 TaxID=1259731 RepID=UPI003F472D20